MSTNRGIFDSFPSQSGGRQDSPFAIVHEPVVETPAVPSSPFAPVARQESPFSVVDEAAEARSAEMSRPVKLPERRKVDSPFQVAEPTEGFGFEAPAVPASPFEIATAPAVAPVPAPFSSPAQAVPASPFAVETPRPAAAPPSVQAAVSAFTQWQEPAAVPAPQPFAPAVATPPVEPAPAAPVQVPAAFSAPTPPPPPAAPAAPVVEETISDSSNIRQLELRAIFGVDREMNADEILQRSRALPGMRNIARVSPADMTTIEALKALVPNLGFGGGNVKLYVGSVPVEFIREGAVMLGVQTDGGFAPGVRETLMIVARELNRIG